MPELPDIAAYLHALEPRVLGHRLLEVRLGNPFLLRTADPPLPAVSGRTVTGLRRLGKRLVFALEGDLFLVLHLMIAGRLHWKERPPALGSRNHLAAFVFDSGSLLLTEAGSKRRASLFLVRGEQALEELDPGGLEVLEADEATFRDRLTRENHTLKRALTDPRILSGIGGAYADEIMHRARLSPVKLTSRLTDEEMGTLFDSARAVLGEWTERLKAECGDGFPAGVTAFRPEMAVHGRFGKPCPDCGAPVQRITYAENETNYCPACQTGGRLLADRALSRLLREDWPRSLAEMEERRSSDRARAAPRVSLAPEEE